MVEQPPPPLRVFQEDPMPHAHVTEHYSGYSAVLHEQHRHDEEMARIKNSQPTDLRLARLYLKMTMLLCAGSLIACFCNIILTLASHGYLPW